MGIRDHTVALLKAHRQRQLEERMAVGPDPGPVFLNTVGKIRRRDVVAKSRECLLREAGLPPEVRFHEFRHTADTQAIHKGVPIHSVSKMLGHSDPAMTLRRYAHVLYEMRDDAAKAIDDLF